MDKSEKLDHSLLGKQRKQLRLFFSSLEKKLGCQNFNSRSVKGLESRFESILLAYSVLLSRAQRRFEGTLRYSLVILKLTSTTGICIVLIYYT